MVGHPEHASALSNDVQPATMVNVGRIYKPRWDDTVTQHDCVCSYSAHTCRHHAYLCKVSADKVQPLSARLIQMASVADRFGMSVQRLIDLNADLANVTDANFIKDGEERVISHPRYHLS